VRLTRATKAQARECVRAFSARWGSRTWLEAVTWWVLDGSPRAGYCGAYVTADGVTVKMTAAYVAPEYRGAGIQRRMLQIRTQFGRARGCDTAYTYTWIENIASQRSIVRAGFLPVRCKLGPEGEAWIVYEKSLR
jgi:GNAT superfamily N-acetyltransferase